MNTILFFLATSLSIPAFAYWDLNDVSYMMPLPKHAQNSGLLTDKTVGAKGDLLPANILQKLPHLTSANEPDHSTQGLQVLALRIEPCFPLPTPQQCQKQIRMVWQPLEMHPAHGLQSVDATLHSFYVLSNNEFANLLEDIIDWKKKYNVQTARLPLNLHPAWKTSKDESLHDFNEIILKYAGANNISRVTIMALRSNCIMWHFLGVDINDKGEAIKMIIPRLNKATQQNFVNNALPFESFFGGFAPKAQGYDTINQIARDSDIARKEKEVIKTEIGAAFRAANPDRHSPNTLDCMTCHIAQPAKTWALRAFPEMSLEQVWDADSYKNIRYDLSNKSAKWKTNNLRAFGYFDQDMYFSQRVINESAAVADTLNLLIPLDSSN